MKVKQLRKYAFALPLLLAILLTFVIVLAALTKHVVPRTNQTYDVGNKTHYYRDAYFSRNLTAENITSTGWFIGDGSQLTGIVGTSFNTSYEYWWNDSLTATYNVTYDADLYNCTNTSYEYWTNDTLTLTYNVTYDADLYNCTNTSYEYWTNDTLTETYNATYQAYLEWVNASAGGKFNDSVKVYFGTDDDVEMYYNGTHFIIKSK